MDDKDKDGIPHTDERQAAAERFVRLQTGEGFVDASDRGGFGFGDREIWRDIAGTERDKDPCGRFAYVAEKLIKEERFRERALLVMREIRSRCYERDGEHGYRFARRAEIDAAAYVGRFRGDLDGVDTIRVVSMRELVPQPSWMSESQWKRAFRRYVEVMTGEDDPVRVRRDPFARMFGDAPHGTLRQFTMPARGVLMGHLVHEPLMGDLAELLALVGATAASNHQDAFYRMANYVMEAAKAPPIVVAKDGGGFHLIHICAD